MKSTKTHKTKNMANDLAMAVKETDKTSANTALLGLGPARLRAQKIRTATKQVHAAPAHMQTKTRGKRKVRADNDPPTTTFKKRRRVGRQVFTSNWTVHEIKILLDAVEQVSPIAKPMWEKVRIVCAQNWQNGRWTWSADSCMNKFQRLCYTKEVTSKASRRCPEMSGLVSRAKKLKQRVTNKNNSKFEIIDVTSDLSDYDFESESETDPESEYDEEDYYDEEEVENMRRLLLLALCCSESSSLPWYQYVLFYYSAHVFFHQSIMHSTTFDNMNMYSHFFIFFMILGSCS